MQEKIEPKVNNFLLPQMLPLQQQKQRLRCPNHNQANSVCISQKCLIPGLMCLDPKCQCRRVHIKCHHILLDRVLESIQKHQKEIPEKVKETYQTIYDVINQMIQKLSKLRTKFEREQQYFGLRQQELNFMQLINDQKIDQVNGKIINSLEKTFDTQIYLNNQSKQDIIKDFQQKNKEFDKLCNYIQQKYLQIKINNEQIKKQSITKLFKDSNIIQSDEQRQLLNKWLLDSNEKKQLKSQLLFRGSNYKFDHKKFHDFCDGKKETLVIIKNNHQKIIGGFTPNPWESKKQKVKDLAKKSFLFSLTLKQKYQCINSQFSIQNTQIHGPAFGHGPKSWNESDLFIANKTITNSSGNLGKCYNILASNQYKYKYNDEETKKLFVGSKDGYFDLVQYEVYQILGLQQK